MTHGVTKRGAFLRTAYEAAGAVARIGRRSPAVEALFGRARVAAFITAWNPFGRRRPAGWNARMQARLRAAAGAALRAEGCGRGRGWAEAHLLVAADPRRLRVLARRFRQAAIVVLRRGAPARLVMLTEEGRRWR